MEVTTVIVSGAIANKHLNGGAAWTRLNWLLGFQKLGFRVFFVEQIHRQNCWDSDGAATSFENSANLAYFKQIIELFDLSGSAALVYENGEQVFGLTFDELLGVAEDAELLVNITGHLTCEALMRRLCRKVYVDLDPGFTQFWHASGNAGPRLDGHNFYFTVGENIGGPHCSIPTADIRWRRTRQPVVLEYWPTSNQGAHDRFTTIGSWRGPYGPATFAGKTFGLKVHEFRKFVTLPERLPLDFEIALDIHSAEQKDLTLLREHGWHIADPRLVASDPIKFRSYVQTSGAEFSVAQGIYVETNSGWFSDRTVRYLASGKPALVQDTGFSRNYPVGEGLIAFRTLDEAIEGAERIASDYDNQSRAARSIAEEYFDSDRVLGQLIDEVGIAP